MPDDRPGVRLGLGVSTYAIAVRRIILERPALDDLIGVPLGPQPVEVVRPADLVHLTFSFENMEFAAGATPRRRLCSRVGPRTDLRS